MKRLIISTTLLLALFTANLPVFATSGVAGQVEVDVGGTSAFSEPDTSADTDTSSPEGGDTSTPATKPSGGGMGSDVLVDSGYLDPNLGVDEIGAKMTEKGEDIIGLMKIVGRYVCIGAFIVSIVSMFSVIFGNKRGMAQGFIGLCISGIMYGAIVMSDEIVFAVATWAAS